jgi:hypothetical protein
MDPDASKSLIERLSQSKIFEDYSKAFVETTGLPLSLQPVEAWQLAMRGSSQGEPVLRPHGQEQPQLRRLPRGAGPDPQSQNDPTTVRCFAGLCDTAVPVRLGNEVVGYLQTGQVFPHAPTRASSPAPASAGRMGPQGGPDPGRGGLFPHPGHRPQAVRGHGPAADHLRRAPVDRQQPAGGPAGQRRAADDRPGPGVHRRTPGRGPFPGRSGQGGELQHLLLLQDVQEGHRAFTSPNTSPASASRRPRTSSSTPTCASARSPTRSGSSRSPTSTASSAVWSGESPPNTGKSCPTP